MRSYEQLRPQLRFLQRQLLAQLDRLWPGAVVNVAQFRQAHPDLEPPSPIVESQPLDRDRLAVLLRYCPDPYQALALGADGLIQLFHEHGYRAGPHTAAAILRALRHSPLPPKPVAALYAQRLQADYRLYDVLRQREAELTDQIAALVPATPARFLDSIPGVSPLLAARYLAAIGDVHYFASASQVWALAGYDLVSAESGDHKHIGHITKRGNPALRDTLYQIGFHTAGQCPPIGLTYLAARTRGLCETAAVIHAAHKANRLCFTLLQEERMYQPPPAEEEQRFRLHWQRFRRQHDRQRQPQAAPSHLTT